MKNKIINFILNMKVSIALMLLILLFSGIFGLFLGFSLKQNYNIIQANLDVEKEKNSQLTEELEKITLSKPDISIYCCQKLETNPKTVKIEEVESLVIAAQISCKCFKGE